MSLFSNTKMPVFISDDFPRKLTALFFACLIWYFVNEHVSEVETFKNVKVNVIPGSSSQVIVSNFKPEITVSVRGPRKRLNILESKDIDVTVNITDKLRPGINELRVNELDIKLPDGLKVESLVTKTVNIDIDNIEEKEVDVRLRYNNRLSERFELLREPQAKPDRVQIKGPSRRLATINYLDTNPIYIDPNRTTDFRVTAKVVTPAGIEMNYDNVTAYVELKKKVVNKTLPVQNIFVLYTGEKFDKESVKSVGKAFAYISGPPTVLEKLDPLKDVRLFIEVGENKQDEYSINFWCRSPEISLVNITPSKIKLK
ncbi:MAG: CdaR family protein [Lentisphaerales bacterium]|nr:CdaR family protein [Lentisphaerales bacterium]